MSRSSRRQFLGQLGASALALPYASGRLWPGAMAPPPRG
ncbi:MAG: twin-arginine translocation signal domain-containing protein, partial [Terriglobales bacterium]